MRTMPRNRTTSAQSVDPDLMKPARYEPGWLCADEKVDPHVFGEPRELADLLEANEYCVRCPKAAVCLSMGLGLKAWGIWGGVALVDGKPAALQVPGYRRLPVTAKAA